MKNFHKVFPCLVALNVLYGCNGSSSSSTAAIPGEIADINFADAVRHIAVAGGTGPTHAGVTTGDFNDDGYPDVAVTDSAVSGINVLLNEGDGSLGLPMRYLAGLLPYALISADLNNDGVLDLAVANSRSDDISVLLGIGDGSFSLPVHYSSGLGPTDIAAVDINNDGALDLLTYYGEVSVHINQGDGSFVAAADAIVGEPDGAIAIAMEVADFNGDARSDIAVTYWPSGASESVITQLLAQTDGSFLASEPSYTLEGATEAMRAADVNCDGSTDLVTPIAGGGLLVQHGAPGTGLGEPTLYETESGSNAVEFGDFNLDGKLDLAVSFFIGRVGFVNDVCSGEWHIEETQFDSVETSEALDSPDFNLDGRPDLVVTTWFSPQIAILLNTAGDSE